MEIHVLHQQGRSIRRIAKDLGISRNTGRHQGQVLLFATEYKFWGCFELRSPTSATFQIALL